MDSDSFLLTIAVIAVVVSVIGVSMTYNSISTFQNILTGYATEEGFVNVSIESSVLINITSANASVGSKTLDWGNGSVSSGQVYAVLASNGTRTNVNDFDQIDQGFIIRNLGNVNVTLNVSSTYNADSWLGAGSEFQYNFSNYVAGSCGTWNSDYTVLTYQDFTTAATTGGICDNFQSGSDRYLRMDVLIGFPNTVPAANYDNTVTLTYETV